MNQKNYKEIARIIKEQECYPDCNEDQAAESMREKIAKELADYFEEEDKKKFGFGVYEKFTRSQFLKDCGVSE